MLMLMLMLMLMTLIRKEQNKVLYASVIHGLRTWNIRNKDTSLWLNKTRHAAGQTILPEKEGKIQLLAGPAPSSQTVESYCNYLWASKMQLINLKKHSYVCFCHSWAPLWLLMNQYNKDPTVKLNRVSPANICIPPTLGACKATQHTHHLSFPPFHELCCTTYYESGSYW